MKKILIAILLLLTAFLLCSCNEPAVNMPSSNSAPTSSDIARTCDNGYHVFDDPNDPAICSRCGYDFYATRLRYKLSETGDSYIVTGVAGGRRTNIVIPDTYRDLPVTEIGDGAFLGEDALVSVVLPAGLKVIGEAAFSGCSALEDITIPQGVTTIKAWAFSYCKSLKQLELPDSLIYMGKGMIRSSRKLTSIRIPDGVTTIPSQFAMACSSLQTVYIGANVISIETSAFQSCKALETIHWGNALETIMNSAFSSCISLTSVALPQTVKQVYSGVFYLCTSLKDISIPETVEYVDAGAFTSCSALQRTVYKGMEYIGNADNPYLFLQGFADPTITDAVLHEETRFISDEIFQTETLVSISVGKNAVTLPLIPRDRDTWPQIFLDPQNQKLHFSGNCLIRTKDKVLYFAFDDFTIPDDGSVTVIGPHAFAFMESAKSVIIPDCVTEIGTNAFIHCRNLEILVIGSGVKTIGIDILIDCEKLTSVYYNGTEEQWNALLSGMLNGNSILRGLTCYFYSETPPTEPGNYWHYVDGVPTPWEQES